MKNIFLGLLAIVLITSPAFASNGGGKKKAGKKAKAESLKGRSCDVRNCDPKNCDPKTCQYPTCPKDKQCLTTTSVASKQ